MLTQDIYLRNKIIIYKRACSIAEKLIMNLNISEVISEICLSWSAVTSCNEEFNIEINKWFTSNHFKSTSKHMTLSYKI